MNSGIDLNGMLPCMCCNNFGMFETQQLTTWIDTILNITNSRFGEIIRLGKILKAFGHFFQC